MLDVPVAGSGAKSKPAGTKTKQKPKQEDIMNWDEFFKQPEAQAKLESLLADTESKAKESVKQEFDGKITKVVNILSSEEYPQKVKAVALKVLRGEMTEETFDAALAMYDMAAESGKSEQAQKEQPPDTEANAQTEQQPMDETGVIVDAEAYVKMKRKEGK